MKKFPLPLIALVASLSVTNAQQQPALLTEPPDGSEAIAPEIRVALRPADVEETTVTRQGGRDITVQRLALDPNDPVKPVISVKPSPAPAVPAGETQDAAPTAPTYLTLLSASVYAGSLTSVRWVHCREDGASIECSGWSNVDFNHFSGISTFLGTDGQPHCFIMGIGNEEFPAEEAPQFSGTAPAFIPDQKNLPAEALVLIDSLHKIYATEGAKLAAAHLGRERAAKAKAAELLANPPQPKDLIIRYRIAETPLPTPAEGDAQ
ncbi:hypothetical protein HZ994_12245 [Akkermansiaceae bacterium]|nr:hypothetical protein HZ994_12245 [Akkermansiaceae bacterium]